MISWGVTDRDRSEVTVGNGEVEEMDERGKLSGTISVSPRGRGREIKYSSP